MADAPISEELTALKKRARRRLVGAVVLMLVALVALWSVMDNKPPPSLASQPVAIVSSEPGLDATVKPDAKLPVATADAPPKQPEPTPAPAPAPQVAQATPAAPSMATPAAPAPLVVDTPKPTPKPAEKPAEPKHDKPPEKPASEKPAEKPAAKPESAKKPEPVVKKDPAKILAGFDDEAKSAEHDKPHEAATGSKFFLQIGAFADADKARSLQGKAHAAGVSVQSEQVSTSKGDLTRLRAGPFNSHEAAEHAQGKLAAAGVTSSIVGK